MNTLNVKSHYSFLNSLLSISQIIEYYQNNNCLYAPLIDKNVLYGALEFYQVCQNKKMKPIIGVELDIQDFTVCLYAINFEGYQNLTKLTTLKSERDLTLDDLKTYNSHLVCILKSAYLKHYEDIKFIYVNLYVGYEEVGKRGSCLQVTDQVIYFKESLYLKEEDAPYLAYALLIKEGKALGDLANYILKDKSLFNQVTYHEEDEKRLLEIIDLCNLQLTLTYDYLPSYDIADNKDDYLANLAKNGLYKRLNGKVPKSYYDRLLYELDVIKKMHFSDYFLVVYDYIKYAKKQGIKVNTRGSAAGSLIAYSIGITDVNPLEYGLLFERFLNPERVSMPDIDVDFEDVRRDEVIAYVGEKYGAKRACHIIAFGTMKGKMSIRDVGKLFNIESKVLDKIVAFIPNITKESLLDIYNKEEKLRLLVDSNSKIKEMYLVAAKLEGLKKHVTLHAAGIVISSKDLDEIVPLVKIDNQYVVGYSYDYLESLGLLKMDFLGLNNLTTIRKIEEKVHENLSAINLNDQQAIDIFKNVNTVGIFQFESAGMKNFLRKLKINNFDEIVLAVALFRPGPMDNIDTYIKRKFGQEKIDYLHPDLINILKPTLGIIVYQEQIMQIASTLSNFSYGEADVLRRAMSKKKHDVIASYQEKFIEGSLSKGYDRDVAVRVYDLILKFANYGFNKAHAVSYALVAYKMAYLKAHHREEFMANLLSSVIGSETKTKEYILEARKNNIAILKPDLNKSSNYYVVFQTGIYYPISGIKNIGSANTLEIINERKKKPFADIYDFIGRTNVNRKVLENLILAGFLDSFGYNKNTLMNSLELLLNYRELYKDLSSEYALKPEIEILEEYPKDELMRQELEVFGFYLANHPTQKYKSDDAVSTEEIGKYFNKQVKMILFIDSLKKITTKNNETMVFINGSDELGNIEVVLFPKTFDKYSSLSKNSIIKLVGNVEKRFDKWQIVAQIIEILE